MDIYLSDKLKKTSFLMSILVVLIHANNLDKSSAFSDLNISSFIQNFVSSGISSIAVPIFFIMSGFLFFYKFQPSIKNWVGKYRKRLMSLFIPFVFWCVSWMIVLLLIQSTAIGRSLFSNMLVTRFSLKDIFKYTFIYPIPFQLWYIKSLMGCVIISPVVYYGIKYLDKLFISVIIVLWFINIVGFPIAMFSVGAFISIKDIKVDKKELSGKIANYLLVLWIVFLVIKTRLAFYGLSWLYLIDNTSKILGIAAFWTCYDRYLSNNIIPIFQYGIFIYFFHEPLQSVIIIVLFKIITRSIPWELGVFVIAPAVTIAICIFTGAALNRYLRKCYSVMVGGRVTNNRKVRGYY